MQELFVSGLVLAGCAAFGPAWTPPHHLKLGFFSPLSIMAGMYCLNDLLKLVEGEKAEELRLESGSPPEMAVGGHIRVLDLAPMTGDEVAGLFRSFAPRDRLEELSRCGDVHFSFSFQRSARFKVSASQKGQNMSLKLRRLSN
jgi:Tfp pilus assembly ATPase PilU